MKLFLVLMFFIVSVSSIYSQTVLKGKVIDGFTGKELQGD